MENRSTPIAPAGHCQITAVLRLRGGIQCTDILCAGFTRPITRAGSIISIYTPKGVLVRLDLDCTVQADFGASALVMLVISSLVIACRGWR